jgi:Tol biopolymer transport system component
LLGDRAAYGLVPWVSLSPDGRRAAVSVKDDSASGQRGRPKKDIWIFDIARGVRTRFTFYPPITGLGPEANSPIWSPDGSRVVFASNRNGHFDFYQKAASGAGAEELLLADSVDKALESWSPDGRFLLYYSPAGTPNGDVWVLPLVGDRKPFPLVQTPFDEYFSQFSPDGRWVAYQSNESGRHEVYVTPFPGHGEKWQVSTGGGIEPRWSRDGNEIFFLAGATAGGAAADKLMAATVKTVGTRFEIGSIQPLFDVRRPSQAQGIYDVSADGRFLIDTAEEQTPITIVVNWPALVQK